MFGFLRRKKIREIGPENALLNAKESAMAYSNLWRRIEEMEERQRLIMNHLGIRIVSYPRIEKYPESSNDLGKINGSGSEQLAQKAR